jgi:hypothetical protein
MTRLHRNLKTPHSPEPETPLLSVIHHGKPLRKSGYNDMARRLLRVPYTGKTASKNAGTFPIIFRSQSTYTSTHNF